MIAIDKARKMMEGLGGIGSPAPRPTGFGIRPAAPTSSPIAAASQPLGLGGNGEETQGAQSYPNIPNIWAPAPITPPITPPVAPPKVPANINTTPSVPGMLSQEVPGKQAPVMPTLNPSVAAPQAPATPSTSQAGGGLAPLPPPPAPPSAPAVPAVSQPAAPLPLPPPPAPPSAPATPSTAQPPAPLPPPLPPVPYANVSPITPGADLRDKAILPGASVDRLGMAKEAFQDYLTNKMPEYRANLRGLVQNNAAFGRSKSGMLRTDAGNLADSFDRNATTAYSGFLRDATDKAVGDQRSDRSEMRGERGYENELEDQSFNRGRQELLDKDYLQGTQFGRDATKTQLGFANDPTSLLAALAAARGGQASQGAAAVGGLAQQSSYLDILRDLIKKQGGSNSPAYGSGEMSGAF